MNKIIISLGLLLSAQLALAIDLSDAKPVKMDITEHTYISSITINTDKFKTGQTVYKDSDGNCHLETIELISLSEDKNFGIQFPETSKETKSIKCPKEK